MSNDWKSQFPKEKVYYETKSGILYNGNVLEVLRVLPDNSVDCVVTSPPYWGLRFYGNETNTIWGGDPNCNHEWDTETVKVALSLSEKSKLNNGKGANPKQKNLDREHITGFCKKCGAWYGQLGLEPTFELYLEHLWMIFDEVYRILKPTGTCWVNLGDTYFVEKRKQNTGVKQKSLCLIPERFAIGMVDRGWILRNTIIWSKKVVFWDRNTQIGNGMPHPVNDRFNQNKEYVFFFVKSSRYYFRKPKIPYTRPLNRWGGEKISSLDSLWDKLTGQQTGRERVLRPDPEGAGASDTWLINTEPFSARELGIESVDHVAPFPTELPKVCIKAGCPEDGIVMDIFMGSGTTAVVAEKLGRKWIGIELNPNYCEIAKRRIEKTILPLFEVEVKVECE